MLHPVQCRSQRFDACANTMIVAIVFAANKTCCFKCFDMFRYSVQRNRMWYGQVRNGLFAAGTLQKNRTANRVRQRCKYFVEVFGLMVMHKGSLRVATHLFNQLVE